MPQPRTIPQTRTAVVGWTLDVLSLYIGKLFGDSFVRDRVDVDASHVSAVPVVAPPLDHPVAGDDRLLGLETRRLIGEDRRPYATNGCDADVSYPAGSGAGGFEHAVLSEESEGP